MRFGRSGGFSIIRAFFLLFGFLLLSAALVRTVYIHRAPDLNTAVNSRTGVVQQPPAAPNVAALTEEEKARYLAMIDSALESARIKNMERLDSFKSELGKTLDDGFMPVNANVANVVEEVSNFKFCCKYCSALAGDFVNDTAEADKMVSDVIEAQINAPCRVVENSANDGLTSFCRDIADNGDEMRVSLDLCAEGIAERLNISGDSGSLAEFDKQLGNFRNDVDTIAVNSVIPIVSEVVFIVPTCEAIRILFAAIAKILSKGAAAGGVAMAADGPLPVGDVIGAIIAVGCTAWSCHDFIEARMALPEQLSSELTSNIEVYRQQIYDSSCTFAEEWINQCNERNSQLCEELKKQLKEGF